MEMSFHFSTDMIELSRRPQETYFLDMKGGFMNGDKSIAGL
jgi:hypothetical protein